jgi:membrane associated rhomboid family serine protease
VIPIQDVIPSPKTPVVTIGLLVLAAVEFLLARWTDAPAGSGWFYGAVNMLLLWIFGDNVEGRLGHGRFAALFGLGAAASAVAGMLTTPAPPEALLLTSGAVAGVMGAYFVLYPRSRVLTLFPLPVKLVEIPAVFFLGMFFVLHLPAGKPLLVQTLTGFGVGASLCFVLRKPLVW